MIHISSVLQKKIEALPSALEQGEIQEIRNFYKLDSSRFVQWLDEMLEKVRKKEDIDFYFFMMEQFSVEIADIAPFISVQINRITLFMEKIKFYRQIAQTASILGVCANVKTLEVLSGILNDPTVAKYMTTIELYQIKKLTFHLSNKLKSGDITYRIDVKPHPEDLEWIDHF